MNPYEILGLKRNCTERDITLALRILAKMYHPDIGGDSDKFAEINKAAQTLKNKHTRSLFDKYGTILDIDEGHLWAMVKSKFEDITNEWIDNQLHCEDSIPLKPFLKSKIENIIDGADEHIQGANQSIQFLEKRKKEIRVQDGETNIVHQAIEARIQSFKASVEKIKRDKVMLGILNDYIDMYESDDLVRINNGGMHGGMSFFVYGSSTSTTGRW